MQYHFRPGESAFFRNDRVDTAARVFLLRPDGLPVFGECLGPGGITSSAWTASAVGPPLRVQWSTAPTCGDDVWTVAKEVEAYVVE